MSVLLYEKKGNIVYLTMNRPESRNALNQELIGELGKAWVRFRDDDDAWVAIVTGAGRAFCAGLDLKERAKQTHFFKPGPYSREQYPIAATLNLWKPVIAAINGPAYAAGWAMAQECDIRIASEAARFAITEVGVGIPVLGLAAITRYMTLGQALEVVFTGDPIDAATAKEIGFVNRVVPPDQLMDAATAMAERICQNAPLAIRASKEMIYKSLYPAVHEIRDAYSMAIPALNSEDSLEGARAFSEGRKPEWKGK